MRIWKVQIHRADDPCHLSPCLEPSACDGGYWQNKARTSKQPAKALKTSPEGDSKDKGTVTAENCDSVEESSV